MSSKGKLNNSVEILIAEDSPTQAAQLQYLLEEAEYQVTSASDGRKALALAQARKPTLIITDVMMPEMDGYALCKEIKSSEQLKDVPVVLVTTLSSPQDVIRGLECGADGFVRKPYESRYLLSRINYVLANRRLAEPTKMQVGVEISFAGKKYFINSERQQILDLLVSTYEEAVHINEELQGKQGELSRSYESLRALHRIAVSLNECTDEQRVLEIALERALEFPGIQAGWISLREGESGFRPVAARGLPPALQSPDAFQGDCLCRRKLLAGDLDRVTNILECERLQRATGDTLGLRYHASVPLWIGDQVVGVMNLAGPDQGMFAEGDLETLYGIGNQIAVALERAHLYNTLETKVEERTHALRAEIAEREQAEESLRLSEERFRKVFEEGPVGMALVDVNLRLLNVNEALCRMLGYGSADLIGLAIAEITHVEDVADEMKQVQRLVSGEIPTYKMEKRFLTKSGKVAWGNLTASVIRGERGDPLFGFQIVEDITERKQLEMQLIQSQKMEAIGRLAGGVAHDFNNLLTVINGYSDLLLGKLPPDDPQRGNLEEIRKAGERAAGLTRQLLAFGRRQVLAPQELDLNGIMANMDRMLRRLIGEDVDLVSIPTPAAGRVKADPSQIEQIIMNLAVNARDAMPKGGKLTIEIANRELDEVYCRSHVGVTPGSYVMLAVSDTGMGMDSATQAQVFEPFFTTKEKDKGTGLGLATVHGIVKQSGGHIWLYSEPGRGTTFKVYLPRIDEATEKLSMKPTPGNEPVRGTETILLVEDEPALRMMARQILESKGYRVLEARSGDDALAVAEQHRGPVHLLLSDVIMPGMSGRELAEHLTTSLRRDMKVLYMSGYTDNAIVHHGVLDPGIHFLQKPFTPSALANKVREVLDTRREEKA